MQMWFYLSWNKKKAQSKTDWSAEMGSYRFPVWTSEVPLLVLCQLSHLDGRLRGPLRRMPGEHTLAALPQIGSAFQCLWCLLAVCSSSGRWNTTRKRGQIKLPDTPQPSFAFTILRTGNLLSNYFQFPFNTVPLIKWKGAHTWCLFSISRPSSMSIGWSSKMEKEQGRKSPSICTWATREQDNTISISFNLLRVR